MLFVIVPSVPPVAAGVLLVGILMLAPPFVAYQTTEFGVTSKRLSARSSPGCGTLWS